ncbi:MAG: hypothetical protein L6R43_01470 [Planctomycetes bacterium]|nr:hypothetical protein [Planctomycetota bacterium]
MATTVVKGVFEGVPTFFRACCYEARGGGRESYKWAGWHLANSLSQGVPYDISWDEWPSILEDLTQALERDDFDAAWKWFEDHMPKCAVLVPRKRRRKFIEGVQKAHLEDARVL